jgi:hypothetical protein
MRTTIITAACLAALVLAACTTPQPQPLPSPAPSPAPSAPSAHAPGLEKHTDGTADAWGYVTPIQLEGGFWAVTTLPVTNKSAASKDYGSIVVVLIPGAVSEAAFASAESTFVHVSGALSTGPSVRMAGPEMTVAKMEPAPAPK